MNVGRADEQLTTGHMNRSVFSSETLFITGCSGFLGKVILEKLLRSYSCKRIFILIRVKKGVSVVDRFNSDILKSSIFERLRSEVGDGFEAWFRSIVVPIPGDLQQPDLALSSENQRLLSESVSVIIHAGASVEFDLPLEQATSINIDGSLEMLRFAKTCRNLKTMCHVSTCYVNSNLRGFIQEKIYPSPFSVPDCYSLIKSSSPSYLSENKKNIIRDWPNTYTFTKFLTEHLLVQLRERVPLIICRPSIIAASLREPVPGWTDTISAASAVFLAGGMGICPPIPGSVWNVADLVPVDLCADMILTATFLGTLSFKNLENISTFWSGPGGSVPIVHCGTSSSDQPMTWFAAADTVVEIFAEHPPPQQLVVRNIPFIKDRNEWNRQTFLRSKLPQLCLGLIGGSSAERAKKALALGDRIVDVFGHFTENEWIFDSHFFRRFSPKFLEERIDWHEYMHLICYGMRRFCLHNPLAQLPYRESLKGDVLQRSTLWRVAERDEDPRRCRGRDLRWVWGGVTMNYDVPSAERIETKVLQKSGPSSSRETIAIIRSLETRFDHSTVRFFGYTLQKLFSSMFERIHVNEDILKKLGRIDAPVLLLPTHRSYLDFLMLSYVLFAYHVKVPFIVAGDDFKRIPGINSILRRSGAFFMKRKFSANELYGKVFKTYFQQVIRDHGMIEFFLEGTRSRSGHSLRSKNGLLSFALELLDCEENPVSDIVIVPVSMSFERVLEAETFPPELLGGKKEKESLSRILRAVSVLKTKYGRANIVFDEPISVKKLRKEKMGITVEGIGKHVINKLNENMTIMSTHAVATVLLADRESNQTVETITEKVEILRDLLIELNVQTTLPSSGTCAYSVSKALNIFLKDVVKVKNDRVVVSSRETDVLLLSYYRNQLLGPLGPEALVVTVLNALRAPSNAEISREVKWLGSILAAPFDVSEERIPGAISRCMQSRLFMKEEGYNGALADMLTSLVYPLVDSLWLTLLAFRNSTEPVTVESARLLVKSAIKDRLTPFIETSSVDWIKSHMYCITKSGMDSQRRENLLERVSQYRFGATLTGRATVDSVLKVQAMISRM